MQQAKLSQQSSLLLVISVLLTSFAIPLTSGMVAFLLVPLVNDFHLSVSELQWYLNVYFLVVVAFVVTGERIGKVWGKRLVIRFAMISLIVATLLLLFATSYVFALLARFFMGLGIALFLSASFTIMKSWGGAERQRKTFAFWGTIRLIAFTIGPVLAGAVAKMLNWHWPFIIPAIFIFAALVITFVTKNHEEESTSKSFDLAGAFLLGLTGFSFVFFLENISKLGFVSYECIGSLIVSTAALIVFIFVERKTADPLVRLSLFKNTALLSGLFGNFTANFSFISFTLLFAIYFQNYFTFYFTPLQCSYLFLATGIPCTVSAFMSRFVIGFIGFRKALAAGFLIFGLGLTAFAFCIGQVSVFYYLIPMFFMGIGLGWVVAPVKQETLRVVKVSDMDDASGLLNIFTYLGSALGFTVTTLVFYGAIKAKLFELLGERSFSLLQIKHLDAIVLGHKKLSQEAAALFSKTEMTAFEEAAEKSLSLGFEYSVFLMAGVALLAAFISFWGLKMVPEGIVTAETQSSS